MLSCPNCNKELSSDATRCPGCGAVFGPGSAWHPVERNEEREIQSRTSRTYWWDKEYTRPALMRESRWLLLFVALANIVFGLIRINGAGISDEIWWDAAGLIAVGVLYAAAALIRLFWVRFAFIFEWLLDLLYSNTVLHAPRVQSVFFFVLGAAFLYKMWRYRNAMPRPAIDAASEKR